MSEDKVYKDGDIVWVKLGNNWWPGEVTGPTRHPEGLIKHLKRIPYCVVKFFNENTYEYVRSCKQIFPFQCAKQEEFIRKGYSLYNSGNSFMEKFPTDVEVAKQLTRRKESSFIINDRPDSIVKAILGQPLIRTCEEYYDGSEYREKRRSGDSVTKILNITQNRNNDTLSNEMSKTQTSVTSTPRNDKNKSSTNSASNNSSNYQCNLCDFTSVRLNVMILHRKMHNNRNSEKSNNSTLSKPTITKSTPAEAAATKVVINADRNQIQQNQVINTIKNICKTKVSTTTTIAAVPVRTSAPLKETTTTVAPVKKTRRQESKETAVIPSAPKAKHNRTIKLQTPTNKSKSAKKSADKEKKEESAYAAILSDFCPSETETSPPLEETQSRRSLRHGKNINENVTEKVTSICIDLLETKTIQKIPKKREYSSLQLNDESASQEPATVIVAEHDVECLGDRETEALAQSTEHSKTYKEDAEDIRRMLLADWSDDDETPTEATVDDSFAVENTESNECIYAAVNNLHTSDAPVASSTPVFQPSLASTGRIRNIPKKDRRDVVLQDFNSDLSLIQSDNADHISKTVAVDLDSSNSSVVEIIEDKQPPAVITINDDEEQELSKTQKNQTDLFAHESKDSDSAITFINDKSTSAATSTTTLSCFDFQEDEDEQDNTTTTISHFKKKYLSGDKLQNLLSTTTDELKEDNAAKSRAELAEKDERLAAEIETLLEQTQHPVADLLNANSFEESMSVKDLPIKERGKRIFKSRNKSRMEEKTNTEVVAVTTVEENLPISAEKTEEYKSNVNPTITEILDNDKVTNESGLEHMTGNIIPEQENLVDNRCLNTISSQEILFSSRTEMPQVLGNNHINTSKNEENEDLLGKNNDCSNVSIGDHNISEDQTKQIEEAKGLTSNNMEKNIDNENFGENILTVQHVNCENNDRPSKEMLNDLDDQGQGTAKNNPEQGSVVTIDQSQVAIENNLEQESLASHKIEICNENDQEVQITIEVGLDIEDNKRDDAFPVQPFEFAEKEDMPENKVSEIETFEISNENFKNLVKKPALETVVPKLPVETINSRTDDKNLKTLTSETNNDNVDSKCQQQCLETISKIHVKTADKLFDNDFVASSQQEQELQPAVDSNVESRLNTTTPTDENSSMGASDTGAEFGSPTSMLSEERLPAFRFQSNQTPQQEIETAEAELQIYNVPEMVHEETNQDIGKSTTSGQIKDFFPKYKPQINRHLDQRLLQQRRFSMDLVLLQTELKSLKRHRLSADAVTTNQGNDFEIPQERLKLLTISQNKNEETVRPKSRHMKITPRRNVSELFKMHSSLDSNIRKNIQKSSSLESVQEAQSIEDIVTTIEMEKLGNENTISPIHENEVLEKSTETKQQVEVNIYKATLDNTVLNEIADNKDLENCTNMEELNKLSEQQQENGIKNEVMPNNTSVEKLSDIESKGEFNPKVNVQTETTIAYSPNETARADIRNLERTSINPEENQQNESQSNLFDDTNFNNKFKETVITEDKVVNKSIVIDSTDENFDVDPAKIPIFSDDNMENAETNKTTSSITLSLDNSKIQKDQGLDTAFSPGVPPPTPQENEVVIESETINHALNTQQEYETNIEGETDITVFPLTPKEKENLNELTNQPLTALERGNQLNETDDRTGAPKENELLEEEVCPLTPLEKESNKDSDTCPLISKQAKSTSESETLAEYSTPQHPLNMVIEFKNNITMPCTPKENKIHDECENVIQVSSIPHPKDLIIECEPSTPHGIIECDHNIPAQVTPEKEIIIENHMVLATPTQDNDIIIEENLRLEKKENILAREFQVLQPKENTTTVDIPQESQPNILQTDADKAAEEFLIEFDSIVNHSHAVEEDAPNNTVAINAEDLINNIIEEVHEDQQIKLDAPAKYESPLQYEPLTTYTVVAPKNSWNQIFKESFNRQVPPAKRRQTICFEISDTKEGVACKKQAFDFESILPVNKTIKRTAERKLTLPAIETKLSNNHQPHNMFALNHNQLTLNKKIIPTTKRKLSIEDNITSFIIERPKQSQQPAKSASGPPPLQRIRTLNKQCHSISKTSIENLSEPPPLQSNDNLFHELFPLESSSASSCIDITQKADGGRVIHQQIICAPTIPIPQNKTTDAKISKNKQIGVDSRGNKYVIIKTPPTDIVVQPTLTSSTAAAATATNNFGTTITIQPLARPTSEASLTKAITEIKNTTPTSTTSSHKQQIQKQQIKQISITVPAKTSLEVLNSPEVAPKTQPRSRRKSAHAKAVAAATAANNNINSAKHRQAMEALSRRLSIASEAPPLAKISRTSSAHVQTQISHNSNLTPFFGDTQISNIAQQQLMQLQQQQQQQQTTSTQLQPPIILNKNAHQQSVIQRKTRKISHQLQHQQPNLQHQQIATTKSSQLQQQQQSHVLQQHQQIQHQIVTQIASHQNQQQHQQQNQQHISLQPPPLQQIQVPTVPIQQQIVQQSDGIIITTAATEDDNVIDSNTQLIALPTQPYPGYSETFLLCKVKGNTCKPVDNVPLYLNHQLNELVPVPLEAIESGHKPQQHQIEIKASNAPHLLAGQTNEPQDSECNLQIANLNLVEGEISAGIVESEHQMHHHNQQQQAMEECVVDESGASTSSNQINDYAGNQEVNTELVSNNGILLNIEGQQVLLDAATFAHLLANPNANTQLISDDGTEYVLTHEVLAALQMQQEQQQALELANAAAVEQQQHHQQLEQSGGSDIIAVALAGSDLYDNDVLTIDTSQGMQLIDGDGSIVFPTHTGGITQTHLTPPAVVTNAVLDQSPIMSTLEVPSSIATAHKLQGTQLITVPSHHLATSSNAALGVGGRINLEDSLAAIGVTTQSSSIPSSLGLPITVTNPNIASKVTSAGPLNEMLQFVSHRPSTAAATAAAVAAAALAGETRIFTD